MEALQSTRTQAALRRSMEEEASEAAAHPPPLLLSKHVPMLGVGLSFATLFTTFGLYFLLGHNSGYGPATAKSAGCPPRPYRAPLSPARTSAARASCR